MCFRRLRSDSLEDKVCPHLQSRASKFRHAGTLRPSEKFAVVAKVRSVAKLDEGRSAVVEGQSSDKAEFRADGHCVDLLSVGKYFGDLLDLIPRNTDNEVLTCYQGWFPNWNKKRWWTVKVTEGCAMKVWWLLAFLGTATTIFGTTYMHDRSHRYDVVAAGAGSGGSQAETGKVDVEVYLVDHTSGKVWLISGPVAVPVETETESGCVEK